MAKLKMIIKVSNLVSTSEIAMLTMDKKALMMKEIIKKI